MSFINDIKQKKDYILLQLMPVFLLFFMFWNLAVLSKSTEKPSLLVIIIVTLIADCMFILDAAYIFGIKRRPLHIKQFIIERKYLWIVMGVFVICFTTILDSWLNLDGYLYYNNLRMSKDKVLMDFNNLMLAGHMSHGYTAFLMIGEFLLPGNAVGVRIIHCIMALITIYCFYEIVNTIMVKKDKLSSALFTAMFAFSPMLMGIIGEINTDFPLLCFFTWMVYCGIKKLHVLQIFCGILLCFSKETGCMLYGFYFIGIVVYRLIRTKKIKSIFSYDIIGMVLGGMLWILNYLFNSVFGWMNFTGSSTPQNATNAADTISRHKINSIGFYPDYILQKLKQMIYINFNWILYGLILILICMVIFEGFKYLNKKVNLPGDIITGIIFSFAAFIVYNAMYITYNHYRYLLPFAFYITFAAVISIIVTFNNERLRKVIAFLIAGILFISNFYTFDPFSKALFLKQGTGTGDILMPCNVISDKENNVILAKKNDYGCSVINNGSVYNFQYAFLGKCFDRTLDEISYDEKVLILMPCQYRDKYGTMASIFGVTPAGINQFYWDTATRTTNINCAEQMKKMEKSSRYYRINMDIVDNIGKVSKNVRDSYERIYYIALPFDPEFSHKNFLSGFSYSDVQTVKYINWKWDIYRLK